MRNTISKFALTAALVLAITFTLSCSLSDENGDGGGSSSSYGGGDLLSSSSNGVGGNPSSSSVGGGNPSSSSVGGCPVSAVSENSVTCGGQTYRTVRIGEQVWFAENLNYAVEGSRCYNDDPANCVKYGRLYNWSTAMALPSNCNSSLCSSQIQTKHQGVCPAGWHIPSDAEWSTLLAAVGGSGTAGTKLKAASEWNDDYYGASGNGTDDYEFSALPGGFGNSGGNLVNVGDDGRWWSASETAGWSNHAYYRGMGNYRGDTYREDYDKSLLFSVRCVKD